nr:transcriptional regulator WhiB [Micrococcus sp.]
MDNAQRLEDLRHGHVADAAPPRRGVPADWFVDPADPDASRRLQETGSLDDLATAFLTAHEDTDSDEQAEATVTALHPGTETPRADRERRGSDSQSGVWLGLPGLADPLEVEGELAWQVDALCAQTDPEAFFPEKGGSTRDAKKVCASCTVRSECLEYALSNDERFGIWGGLSERERRRLRKRSS